MRGILRLTSFVWLAMALAVVAETPEAKPAQLELLHRLAAEGDAEMQVDLAEHYFRSGTTPEATAEGLKWLRQAAAHYAKAQYKLAVLYEEGSRVDKDMTEAITWYTKAAEGRYAQAEFRLGECYENGTGVVRSYGEAMRWYQRAADREMREAEAAMARFYASGSSGFKSLQAAKPWAMAAAGKGDTASAELLSRIEETGDRQGPDLLEAGKWALIAASGEPPRKKTWEALEPQFNQKQMREVQDRVTKFKKARREGLSAWHANEEDVIPRFEKRMYVELPAVFQGNQIILPVSIGESEPYPLILDTGASTSMLDRRVAQALNLDFKDEHAVGGVGSEILMAATVNGLTCRIGGLEFAEGQFSACPMDYLRPYGEKIRGLLGHNFLCRVVVEIDYAKGKVRFHDPKYFRYNGNGQMLPLRIEDSALYVRTGVVGENGRVIYDEFLLDTGFGGGINITRYFLRDHAILQTAKTIEGGNALGVGGTMKAVYGRVPAVVLGKSVLKNPIALFSTSNQGGLAHMATGLLGARILQRFHVYIDYSRKQLILEPNEYFSAPFEGQAHGLRFILAGQEFKISDVIAGTPAEEAGFKVGDVLVAVDGKPAGELTLDKVYQMIGDDKEHEVELRRGMDHVKLKIKTRPFI